jgi:type II secretory pathway component HofQ
MNPDLAPTRADPFSDLDLSGFQPTTMQRPAKDAVRVVSEQNSFPSRAPKSTPNLPRRRRTGRNVQLNIKATAVTIARFTALADQRQVAFGELLEHALDALEAAQE